MSKKIIAYLIQAHHQEQHLFDMITQLQSEVVDFYIHIDAKSDINLFNKFFINSKNVFFIDERVSVTWKGFSQVQASLNLIVSAVESGGKYKNFVLLSGSDFPIKSNNEILEFFSNNTQNYVEYREIKKSNSYLDYFKNKQLWFKISKWHFYDTLSINWNSKNKSLKHWLYRFYILFNILILNFFLKKKVINSTIKYYFGSSWWIIEENTILYIYDNFITNEDSCEHKIFRYSDAPDEMFFHTIIMNSKYADITLPYNLHYIDWDTKREGPAVLELDDLDKILNSEKLFARKFGKKSESLKKRLCYK